MDTKILGFRQVCWAHELFYYYFYINYPQSKANAAADALSMFSQKNQDEKKKFQAENSQIFYCL